MGFLAYKNERTKMRVKCYAFNARAPLKRRKIKIASLLYFKQFMITFIIISFSSGFDSAIIIVSATNV